MKDKTAERFRTFLGGVSLVALVFALYSARNGNPHEIAYRRALLKYGDTNSDNVITADEENEFNVRILKDTGIVSRVENIGVGIRGRTQRTYYTKDGTPIPKERITELIENYERNLANQ